MTDPFLCRRKRANQVCSFNGKFQPSPPSGNLWYTGGDTRIVSRLKSKVSELLVLCPNNGGASFSLRYRLPVDDEDAPLVLITSDDDVWFMIDDYDTLESYGKPTRLWIFVSNRSGNANRQLTVNNISANCFETENLNGGFGVSCGNSNGSGGNSGNSVSHWSGGEFDDGEAKNPATGVNGVRYSDESLRKMVPKQQLLAKQSAQIRSFQSGSGLAVEQTEKEFTSENQKHDQLVTDLTSEPQGPVSHETTDMKFGSNPYRENLTPWSPNCDSVKSHFAPLSCSNQLIRSDNVRGCLHSGISNHRFTASNAQNQRTCSYNIQNHRNVRLEGRPWVGKFYPGLSSSSNISKPGQAMRLYHPSLWKLSYGYHDHTPEGIGRMMYSGLNYQTHSLDQPYSSKENFTDKGDHGVPQHQMSNPNEFHFACNGSYAGLGEIVNFIKNPLTSIRAVDAQEDLLTGSNGERCEVLCQAPCKNLHGTPRSSKPICCDFETESQLMEPVEAIDISGSQNNLGSSNGTEVGCNGELHHRSAHAVQGGLASSVDLSLCNLSLSSSKEVETPDHSSPTSNDVSKALRKPQSKPLDLMDEEHLSSGPQVETSNAVACDSTSQNVAKLEKVDEQKEEMQQVHSCISSIGEKDDIKELHKFSMANGGIPSDLAAVYTHLASRGLQTIKSSDLEYIKELGSGAYGAVFYGKWKGCDVAIKKLKLSCFTEGAPGQDKVVADFWKEARILEQLHHPRIIAFYGVVTDGPITNLATVTEYMVNGSLKQVLQKKDRTIDRRKRLIIAIDAASGMEYLHEKNIVHFDLKSHNLLVNMKDPMRPVCKIGDLGLSKIKQKKLVSGGVRGTIPWMAPELLSSEKNMVTEKVDVYSFGIVMWELLAGEEPYGKMRSEEIIGGIIKGNLRPEIPSWCDPAWRSLMERCWSSDPDSRPAFLEIAKELRSMAAAMNIK